MSQISFFDTENNNNQPLAARMRPRNLDEFVGQKHLVGEGKVLRNLIERDSISSMIFWGPPGVGKTTLAQIIAAGTNAQFITFSAVTSGIKEIKNVMQQADRMTALGARTIVFVDEIHRLNKAQQDAFLPFVEKGSRSKGADFHPPGAGRSGPCLPPSGNRAAAQRVYLGPAVLGKTPAGGCARRRHRG